MIADSKEGRKSLQATKNIYMRIVEQLDKKIAELEKAKEIVQSAADIATDILEGGDEKYSPVGDKLMAAQIMRAIEDSRAAEYSHLTVLDAAKKYLDNNGEFATTKEIVKALTDGGYYFKAKDPYRTVYQSLTRAVDDNRGIIKKNSKWGLSEWRKRKPRS
jgi:hypothetical protein